MKKIIILTLTILCSAYAMAQKETAWWHFGYYSGLNFNNHETATASDGTVMTDLPEPVVGPIYTNEGCFTVSTYDGQLLFSSDGTTVYDKNNNVMTNGTGLLGGNSSTQSGIAIPKPGSTTEYYVVTVSQDHIPNGIRYSTIDISKYGGLGEVVSKNNIIKTGVVDENIAAVPNDNGEDYWLIHRTGQTFYIWAITASGISSTPHQTLTSTAISTAFASYVGEIILSSDYKRLVACNWTGQQIISADFNPATGFISGIRAKTVGPTIFRVFGGAFSPNNEYVYIATGYTHGANLAKLYYSTWANLIAGGGLIFLRDDISNVRKGMDNRLYGIYMAGNTSPTKHLYVITNPDNGGTDIKYFPNYLKEPACFGLPSFAAGFIRIKPTEQPFACAAHDRTYSVEIDLAGGNIPSKLEWYFGDGSARIMQTVTSSQSKYSQVYSYNNGGVYTIEVTPIKADGTKLKTITMEANIVYCTLKTNRMTRSDLLNSKQQQ